jgi:hypothetical protein
VSGHLHAPAASLPRKEPFTHWTGRWVGRKVRLDVVWKTKMSRSCRQSSHDSLGGNSPYSSACRKSECIRKVPRPAISTQAFLGLPLVFKRMLRCVPSPKLLLPASHGTLPTQIHQNCAPLLPGPAAPHQFRKWESRGPSQLKGLISTLPSSQGQAGNTWEPSHITRLSLPLTLLLYFLYLSLALG